MCGLTALSTECLTAAELNLLRAMYYESSIRGLHAFGATFGTPGLALDVHRYHRLGEMLAVMDGFEKYLRRPFIFLGHTRYDTSGDWRVIENNQPLVTGDKLLIFNGVIRMSTKAEYQLEFGREYPTDNDGHIALEMFGRSMPELLDLMREPAVSFAGLFYNPGSRGAALRNDRRPLWEAWQYNSHWMFSTYDMAARSSAAVDLLHNAMLIPSGELVLL